MRLALPPLRWAAILLAVACTPPPAAPETTPPRPPVAAAPSPAAAEPAEGAAAEESFPEEDLGSFGFGPDEIAVLDWTRGPDHRSGQAHLRLPSGEMLTGHWIEIDSRTAGKEGGRIVATNPLADAGDPTTMPAGATPARELIIDLAGAQGQEVKCTLPLKTGLGGRGPTGVGTCHGQAGQRFRVRLR